jgi:hypothetical protein
MQLPKKKYEKDLLKVTCTLSQSHCDGIAQAAMKQQVFNIGGLIFMLRS